MTNEAGTISRLHGVNSFLILIMLRELRKIQRLAQESNMDWTLRRDMK
jgi:hypothetical protein